MDLIQEIHQKLIGTNTTERIFFFGVGVSIALLDKRRSSDRDVIETQINYYFMNRKSDSELMKVLNFLDVRSRVPSTRAQVTSLSASSAKDWSSTAAREC